MLEGDYLNNKNQKIYKTLNSKYYLNALSWIENIKTKVLHFFR